MARKPRSTGFFATWTPVMAYVLGYWWADGCMRIKHNTTAHEVRIASNDLNHLHQLAEAVGETYDLRRVAPQSNTYVLAWCSKMMYQDLEQLGGTPRKSLTIGFPPVPALLLAHFVRGVIDGDGTLVWNGSRPVIQLYSGSPNFLRILGAAVADATGIPSPEVATNRDNWYIKWSTIRAKCLAIWLYHEYQGLALERKAAIARQFIDWQPKKRPNQGTITEAMQMRFAAYLPPSGA